MDFISVFVIAIGLAMDAFAVSVCNGVVIKKSLPLHMLRFALYFGVFQFVMPLLGFAASRSFSAYIVSIDHWVAFFLLAFSGGKMLVDAMRSGDCEDKEECRIPAGRMMALAVATSIDALAVGVGFAVMDVDILAAAALIGVVAFLLSGAGVLVGNRMGCVMQKGASVLGGVILIGIGTKTLIEHLLLH